MSAVNCNSVCAAAAAVMRASIAARSLGFMGEPPERGLDRAVSEAFSAGRDTAAAENRILALIDEARALLVAWPA